MTTTNISVNPGLPGNPFTDALITSRSAPQGVGEVGALQSPDDAYTAEEVWNMLDFYSMPVTDSPSEEDDDRLFSNTVNAKQLVREWTDRSLDDLPDLRLDDDGQRMVFRLGELPSALLDQRQVDTLVFDEDGYTNVIFWVRVNCPWTPRAELVPVVDPERAYTPNADGYDPDHFTRLDALAEAGGGTIPRRDEHGRVTMRASAGAVMVDGRRVTLTESRMKAKSSTPEVHVPAGHVQMLYAHQILGLGFWPIRCHNLDQAVDSVREWVSQLRNVLPNVEVAGPARRRIGIR